jgi:hypothetical protein
MKRLFPVLAAALILVLTISDDASSRRYPNLVIDVVQFDHPWGGEQNTTTPPATNSVTPAVQADFIIIRLMKSWNYRIFYNAPFIRQPESRGTTSTTSTTIVNDSNPGTSQEVSQRGMGQ